MKQIYLLRHAQSAPDKNLPEPEWPLSKDGFDQAETLVPVLANLNIEEIISSPYRRAVATVKPFSTQAAIEIGIHQDLRERSLTNGRMIDTDDWWDILKNSWADFNFKLPDCESGLDCQQRMLACVRELADTSSNESILISSHGNAISLFLNRLDSAFGFDGWRTMKNPDLFRVDYDGESFDWNRTFQFKSNPE